MPTCEFPGSSAEASSQCPRGPNPGGDAPRPLSSYQQGSQDLDTAIQTEFAHGMRTIATREMIGGLERYAAGAWREQSRIDVVRCGSFREVGASRIPFGGQLGRGPMGSGEGGRRAGW